MLAPLIGHDGAVTRSLRVSGRVGRWCSPAVNPVRHRGRDRRADPGPDPGRARLGLVGEDQAAARRAARRGHAALLRAGRRQRDGAGRGRSSRCAGRVPRAGRAGRGVGLRGTPGVPRSMATSRRRDSSPSSAQHYSGNLLPDQRAAFLARVQAWAAPGRLLPARHRPGLKDPATLVAAYDDDSGVTAEFNKNVLAVLNAGSVPTSTRTSSSTWRCGTARPNGSRCGCAR